MKLTRVEKGTIKRLSLLLLGAGLIWGWWKWYKWEKNSEFPGGPETEIIEDDTPRLILIER